MDIDHHIAISYYKPIASINKAHHVELVQHNETKLIAVKKMLYVYNRDVIDQLYHNSVTGTPRILDYYEENNCLTIIEEYISGISLREKIDKQMLSSSDVFAYMLDLCDILSQLHSHVPAIIHRDIKPENIIITSYNKAMLLDFNAAKYYTSMKAADTILLGTHGYAAPEQYGFEQSSPQTDIYSLGIVLKEMASACQLKNTGVNTIIDTCTQMDPSNRYLSVKCLRNALCEIHDANVRTQESPHPSVNYTLPGFRSKTPWKMLAALPLYMLIAWFSLTLQVEHTFGSALWIVRIFVFSAMLSIVATACNYLNCQTIMPLCRSPQKILHILGIIILDFFIISGLFFLLTIIQFFCQAL